jgi:uncharacterized phage protein gp47/JayE
MDIKQAWEIKSGILEQLKNTLSKIEGSYNYDIAASTAIQIEEIYQYAKWLETQCFPWSVNEDEYLDAHLAEFGLERRGATAATGTITIEGKASAIISSGSIVVSTSGVKYTTLENVLLDANGKGSCSIECLETGTVGNCGVGDIQYFETAIKDVYKCYNEDAIESGFDIEPFEEAMTRMYEKARNPAHSGNVNDYTNWAKSISGVGKVKVISAGEYDVEPGHVRLLIADYDLQPAPTELIENVQTYINTVKPVGIDVSIESFEDYSFSISLDIRVKKGVVTEEEFKENLTNVLNVSLGTEEFTSYNILSLAKIGNLIMTLDGVVDYDNLTINSKTSNISLTELSVATLKEITVVNFYEVE